MSYSNKKSTNNMSSKQPLSLRQELILDTEGKASHIKVFNTKTESGSHMLLSVVLL